MSTTSESFLVGLVGSGVTPSLTPPLHEREADRHGLRYLYRPLDLERMGRRPDEIGDILREAAALGFNACNVTAPVKELAVAHLDTVSPEVERLGAANTVLMRDGRLHGENTDVTGFAAAFRTALNPPERDRVVLFGAGGAGSSVATALLNDGVRELAIVDVDAPRAAARAERLLEMFAGEQVVVTGHAANEAPALVERADGVVNATFVGMHNAPGTPFDVSLLRPAQWVADIVYRPLRTRLLEYAGELGCRTMDGGHMACGQAVDAFRLITGREPDAAAMRRDFATLVEAESSSAADADTRADETGAAA